MNVYVISEQIGLQGYWITDILDGISKEAIKKNISVVDYEGQKLELNDEFTRPLVLTVGYSSHWIENTCNHLKGKGVEPVLVNANQDSYFELLNSVGFACFGIRKAMYSIMNYLISNKRTKIAFFGAHDETHSDDIKIEEFLKLSRHFGLSSNGNDVYRDTLLSECSKGFQLNMTRYNAIICSSDAAAVFLVKWLENRNVKVPDNMFIIGFGNSAVSACISPTITTVECNYIELGKQSVKLHQFLQKNNSIDSASISVDCRLIERESTKSIKPKRINFNRYINMSIPLYDSDPDVMMVLQAEELLRMWDDIDKKIVAGLVNEKTIVSIAEGLFISVSAVKYRIKKMLTATSLKNKDELIGVLKKYNVL